MPFFRHYIWSPLCARVLTHQINIVACIPQSSYVNKAKLITVLVLHGRETEKIVKTLSYVVLVYVYCMHKAYTYLTAQLNE